MTQRARMQGVSVGIVARATALRRARGWSAQRLGEAMAAQGIPWDRGIVANIESRRRTALTVDEWLGLARALDVAPVELLVDDEPFAPTPTAPPMDPQTARTWIADGGPVRVKRGTATTRGAVGGSKTVESLAERVAELERRIDERET
jgi:transcriptional regulator with XRE-family HTH domain